MQQYTENACAMCSSKAENLMPLILLHNWATPITWPEKKLCTSEIDIALFEAAEKLFSYICTLYKPDELIIILIITVNT